MFGPIKTVGIYVTDQDKALAFYRDTLGFELRRDLPMGSSGRWIEVAPQGVQTSLVLYPRAAMKDWAERRSSTVFHCDDVEGTCATLAARGVTITMAPSKLPWGTFAMIADPDGNELGLTSQELA